MLITKVRDLILPDEETFPRLDCHGSTARLYKRPDRAGSHRRHIKAEIVPRTGDLYNHKLTPGQLTRADNGLIGQIGRASWRERV